MDGRLDTTSTEDDHTQVPATRTYKIRWYILLMFILFSSTQGIIWSTWGPIDLSVRVALDWTSDTIALLTNWGPVTYLLSILVTMWLIEVHGLRVSLVAATFCSALGAAVRCVPVSSPNFTWCVHIGQFLNGLAGPVAMSLPPVISAVWFPANQRTTATAISSCSLCLSVAFSMIIGPLVVPTPDQNQTMTDIDSNNTGSTDVDYIRHRIQWLMYGEAMWAAALFLTAVIYFPAAPKMPPSLTASIPRLDLRDGIKRLLLLKRFWLLALAYALSTGITAAWCTTLAVNLTPLGVTQDQVGWMGFYANVAGAIAGVIFGIFADVFSRHLRAFLVLLFSVSFISYVIFALQCIHVIPFYTALLYASIIIALAGVNGATPLLFEMVCENTYPIAEGITNGTMTLLNNIVALVFFCIMLAPLGTAWMNWAVVICIGACVPILLLYRDHYTRLDVDTNGAQRRDSFISSDDDPLLAA